MKEYTALHYVRDHAGCIHTPGEIFDAEYDQAAEERLLRLGAICENGSAGEAFAEIAEICEDAEEQDAQDEDTFCDVIDVMEGITEPKTAKRSRRK